MIYVSEAPHAQDASRGMVLMTIAMLIIPAMDAIGKVLTATLSPVEVSFLRYAMQAVLLAAILAVRGRPILIPALRAALPRLALAGFFMGIAVGSLFWSFQTLPLANAIAIFFVAPLILTVFGALFLGERVGLHRTAAVLVGLAGAFIVIRPNFAAFGAASILPLVAATGYAGFATTIRSVGAGLDGVRINTVTATFASLLLGAGLLAGLVVEVPLLAVTMPTPWEWALLVLLGTVATLCQFMTTTALKLAEASLLAPLQYLEILGATLYGYLIFGDFPDRLTWVGTALILSAGFYVFHRERVLRRRRRAPRLAASDTLKEVI